MHEYEYEYEEIICCKNSPIMYRFLIFVLKYFIIHKALLYLDDIVVHFNIDIYSF